MASKELVKQALDAARAAARDYRGASETQHHRGAVREFARRFELLSRVLRSAKLPMPGDLLRAYNDIVVRNGMLFGGGPSGGSAESELESALQELDRYVAGTM